MVGSNEVSVNGYLRGISKSISVTFFFLNIVIISSNADINNVEDSFIEIVSGGEL